MIAFDEVASEVIIRSNNLGEAYISIEIVVGLKDLTQSYVLNLKRLGKTHTHIYIYIYIYIYMLYLNYQVNLL